MSHKRIVQVGNKGKGNNGIRAGNRQKKRGPSVHQGHNTMGVIHELWHCPPTGIIG